MSFRKRILVFLKFSCQIFVTLNKDSLNPDIKNSPQEGSQTDNIPRGMEVDVVAVRRHLISPPGSRWPARPTTTTAAGNTADSSPACWRRFYTVFLVLTQRLLRSNRRNGTGAALCAIFFLQSESGKGGRGRGEIAIRTPIKHYCTGAVYSQTQKARGTLGGYGASYWGKPHHRRDSNSGRCHCPSQTGCWHFSTKINFTIM